MRLFFPIFLFVAASVSGWAREINTNEVHISQAPDWLTQSQTQRVIDEIERTLEWDIRKIQVSWYAHQDEFQKMHGMGPSVLAFAQRKDGTVHVGPRVNSSNFAGVFGHELVHIIVYQKYKSAIPGWLDEGLANYVSHRRDIDYSWLGRQPSRDVRTLTHPFDGSVDPQYAYMASTALMEMIARHCSVADLLQLSVGKKLETYLSTFCRIDDLNAEFVKWVKTHAHPEPKS